MGGYVEDDHQLKTSLDHGMRFQKESNRFEYSKDAKKEDEVKKQSGESATQRMARVCAEAMDFINTDLKFPAESPEN